MHQQREQFGLRRRPLGDALALHGRAHLVEIGGLPGECAILDELPDLGQIRV